MPVAAPTAEETPSAQGGTPTAARMIEAQFRPIERVQGYLPLEDFGLIGDGSTAALVGRDGAIAWLCLPRFDSQPLFCSLLDAAKGGSFLLRAKGLRASRQYYEGDTPVLVTELQTDTGFLRITDALLLRVGSDLAEDSAAGRGELGRLVEVLSGEVDIEVDLQPRGGAAFEPTAGGFRVDCPEAPELKLHLHSEPRFAALPHTLKLAAGERLSISLRWRGESHRYQPLAIEELIEHTRRAWREWLRGFTYEGPRRELVLRSAITIKLLHYLQSGAIVAAPTSSLPEAIGGVRNWDYRYAWIRDAAFSVYALRRVGLANEAARFLSWVLDTVEQGGRPRVLYDIEGQGLPPEREDPDLEGYRGSRPVRWGNAAAEQRQHDVFGEIIDCAYQWAAWGGQIDDHLWARLREFIDAAKTEWLEPDHGIWEVRTSGRPFTYSAALCQVALQRGAALAERFGLPGPRKAWRTQAERIRIAILEDAWDEGRGAITEHLGGGALDASILALPLRRVIPADHPRMVSTASAIQRELGAGNGLLYRYLPEKSPDGIQGHEGAFLLCSFWLVDNLAHQGQLEAALDLYGSLCDRAGPLGLLPEQIDPATGAFLGNYPQAFSHVGVISSGINLNRLLNGPKGTSAKPERKG